MYPEESPYQIRLTRAVDYALVLMKQGVAPGLANKRAADRFELCTKDVARQTGLMANRAKEQKSMKALGAAQQKLLFG